MKIGYVLKSLEDSGVTVYCLRLAEAMRERGHDVFLVSDGGRYLDEVARLRLRHRRLALGGGAVAAYLAARQLPRIVAHERPDILHGNWRRAQLACHLAHRKLGTPFVTTLHLVGIPDNWLYRRMTYWGQRVIAPCTEAVAYLRERFGVPEDRIRLIFHAADPQDWPPPSAEQKAAARTRLGLARDAPVLVCVGRLEKVKGHDVLLAALAEARLKSPALRLLLVGAGAEEARLRVRARELGLESAVTFLGWTDPHEALAAADAFVLASHKESFGIAPLEAMLTGLAVIRTDTEGARDQITPGETGLIVPVGDVRGLAGAVAEVASDRPGWMGRGQKARHVALERFTIKAMSASVEQVYAEVVG